MKRILALALCAPLLALTAPANAAVESVPTAASVTDPEQDVTLSINGSVTNGGFPHDIDLYAAGATKDTDAVQFTMTINRLSNDLISGRYTNADGKKKPIGYFSFMVRLDDQKKPSLVVGRWKGQPGVFDATTSKAVAIDCGDVAVEFLKKADQIRYTVPEDCFGDAETARTAASTARFDSDTIYAYDRTKYTKAFKVA